MGRANLQDMLECVNERVALEWHLAHNHYPPVPAEMVEPCLEAIALIQTEDEDAIVVLPRGITYRGDAEMTASELVNALHLTDFVFRGME